MKITFSNGYFVSTQPPELKRSHMWLREQGDRVEVCVSHTDGTHEVVVACLMGDGTIGLPQISQELASAHGIELDADGYICVI